MDLFCFIECAKQSRSPEVLFDLLVSCSSEQGFSQVAYGALTDAEPTRRPEYLPAAVTVSFPSAWRERYAERRYNAIDPVVRYDDAVVTVSMGSTRSQDRLQPGEVRVLNEAKEAGLKHGVTVPLFGPFGRLCVVSFASRFDDVDPQYRLSRLNALAWQFHHAFTKIAPSSEGKCHMKVALSEREKDCLRWVEEGKSS
ncbi:MULTISPECIES: autoinducer binding domain-containing protein [unclassified Bradyrhizobium]|uniref:autoinducer binding domain-containing protein n=1 Tax=unclassified Bradyrhizobium TaxID=2631580 RepID=UPI001FF9DD71|nr:MULTISPECIES: autoinducer binding domain-containing protein [unclassified Bradyrhizobium]MCK1353917.1 autoinducer binding domain-containing protein [Bradyrhizobium sp. CW7]UPJ94814.1 autoinducer binding domain-containing protein [Bradyrhizobium sp. 172]